MFNRNIIFNYIIMGLGSNTDSHSPLDDEKIQKIKEIAKKVLTRHGKTELRNNKGKILEEYKRLVATYNNKTDKEKKEMIDDIKELLKEKGPDQKKVLTNEFKKMIMIEESLNKQSSHDTPHPDTIQEGGNLGHAVVIAGAIFMVVTLGAGLAALSHMTPEQAAELGENIASFNDGWDAARLGGSKHQKRKGRKTKKSMKHKKGKKSKKARKTKKKKKSKKKRKSDKKKKSMKKRI